MLEGKRRLIAVCGAALAAAIVVALLAAFPADAQDDGSPDSGDYAEALADAVLGSPTLTVTKEIVGDDPDPDGSRFLFDVNRGGFSSLFEIGDGEQFVIDDIAPGETVNVLELATLEWTVDVTCDAENWFVGGAGQVTVTFGEFEHVTCTYVNEPRSVADVTITKEVIGTDPDSTTFTLLTSGGQFFELGDGDSGSFLDLPGPIFFTEFLPFGWRLADVDCIGALSPPEIFRTGTGVAEFQIEAGVDQPVECTVVNEKLATIPLTITKLIVGDPDPAGSTFQFTLPDGSSVELADGESVTTEVPLETFSFIAENLPVGWKFDAACTGVDAVVLSFAVEVFAPTDATEADCVITNTYEPDGLITIVKEIDGVDPDPDGTEFTFFGPFGTAVIPAGTPTTLPAGLGFNFIDELVPPGWQAVSAECTGDSITLAPSAVEVNIFEGDEVTCTFVNRPLGPSTVTLTKVADPADGTLFDFSWGPTSNPTGGTQLGDGDSVQIELDPAEPTLFVTELLPLGWTADTVTCTPINPVFAGTQPDRLEVFLDVPPESDVECVIENRMVEPARLTITKELVGPDDGLGFRFTHPTIDGSTFLLQPGQSQSFDLNPGGVTVAEFLSSTHTLESIDCGSTVPDFVGIQFGQVAVTLEPGADVECVFTNRTADTRAITVTKLVEGDDDGTRFTIYGPDGVVDLAGGESHVFMGPVNQPLIVGELLPPGWSPTSISCDAPSGPINPDLPEIEIGPGVGPVDCLFVNAPSGTATVRVTKATVGPADDSVHLINVPGGQQPIVAGETIELIVSPGGGFVSELPALGWAPVDIDCTIDGGTLIDDVDIPGRQAWELDVDGVIDCVITNERVPTGTLLLTKAIDGADDGLPFTFFTGDDRVVEVGAGETVSIPVAVGTSFLREDLRAGWDVSDMECDVDDWFRFRESFQFTIDGPDTVSCTVTNVAVEPAILNVTKAVDGFDGGEAFTFIGRDGEPVLLRAGESFAIPLPSTGGGVFEDLPPGWDLVAIDCDTNINIFVNPNAGNGGFVDVQPQPGEVVNCTFTNTLLEEPRLATLTVAKQVLDGDGSETFPFVVEPGEPNAALGDGDSLTLTVRADIPIVITETVGADAVFETADCPGAPTAIGDGFVQVTLPPDSDITCTFVNRVLTPTGGEGQAGPFTPIVNPLPELDLGGDGTNAQGASTPAVPSVPPSQPPLAVTGTEARPTAIAALLAIAAGSLIAGEARRRADDHT